ncbi:MAG: bifunctional diaminohydroxyphosphoribosylaminopyrimidine deaminase/5-amino-6-(5-phosphoribosylamino)uracil reductase RibD [Chlorobiaceae bacterium]|nr:bifunctional diaminohydroxyphosphoribosylaminopyrimidine deaminase/5-amino-6-(5-phosphoribosylamino)uracil reductase RibD [Chlorobiaceae bacterium]MBA4309265.1 bifunctional diaminohydroxyphosphoribosylaminopyrimidine deaminase/5-amino-6-(5-phosphoribosylamino)uracil reductase RibD [Chlorobiaceae bacterium]
MTEESYIKLTLEIAKKGLGKVSPNPLVGCVIVKNQKIIGAGFHQKYGEAHAEINAIKNATESIKDATLYVNLEPCAHFGKTPPCVDELINQKIKKVVIGTLDSNPLVAGKGVEKLLSNGIEVKVGVLEDECKELNKFFFNFIEKKIPYVTLKAAQTIDSKIADTFGESKWISSKESRKFVHEMRSKYDAVLVGANTVLKDDPKLDVRLIEGRNPKRLILDARLRIKLTSSILNSEKNVTIITSKNAMLKRKKIEQLKKLGVNLFFIKNINEHEIDIKSMLKTLAKNNVTSLLVEGGGKVFSSFLNAKLFNEIRLFLAPKILGNGINTFGDLGNNKIEDALKLRINKFEKIGDDIMIDFRR